MQDGVAVLRVPLFPSHSASGLARFANFTSFAASSALASGWLKNADVNYAYFTSATAVTAALVLAPKVPFVLNVQDLWPESVTGSGMISPTVAELVANVLNPWLAALYRRASAVVGISPSLTAELVARGADLGTAQTIFNVGPENERVDIESANPRFHHGLRLLYAGNIGVMQDVSTIIKAMALIKDLTDVTLDVIGDGVEAQGARAEAANLSLDRVAFYGRQPKSVVEAAYSDHDFQIVTLKDLPLARMTMPSKIQEGLAAGMPIITTVAGDVTDLVSSNKIGLCAKPGDPTELAKMIRRAYSFSGDEIDGTRRRAKTLYDTHMSPEKVFPKWESLLHEVAR